MGMCNGISNDFTDGGKGKLAKVWDDWRIAMGDSGLDLEEDGMAAGRAVLSGGWIWTRLQRTDEWAWAPLPPERTALHEAGWIPFPADFLDTGNQSGWPQSFFTISARVGVSGWTRRSMGASSPSEKCVKLARFGAK